MTANRFTRSRHGRKRNHDGLRGARAERRRLDKVMSRSAQPVSVAVATNRPELGDKIRLIPGRCDHPSIIARRAAAGAGREADAVARLEGSRIRSAHSSGMPASRRPIK